MSRRRIIHLLTAMRLAGGGLAWYRAGGAPAPVAVYQPKGAASLAASYVNLVNPGTYDAAPGVAPTFAASTGWTFNRSTQYLATGIAVGASRAYSLLVRFSNANIVNGQVLAGAELASGAFPGIFVGIATTTADKYGYENGAAAAGTASLATSGVLAVAGNKGYIDGADDGVTLTASAGTITQDIYIGARNYGGTANLFYGGNILAVAIYSSTLTPTQVAAVSTAMAAL